MTTSLLRTNSLTGTTVLFGLAGSTVFSLVWLSINIPYSCEIPDMTPRLTTGAYDS